MFARKILAAAVAGGVLLAGCSSGSGQLDEIWSEPIKAEEYQGKETVITTYALPDEWANYGELLESFCSQNEISCTHNDTDMSSGEAIQRYAAEAGNAAGFMSDIGGLWGPVAEDAGVAPGYVPEAAEKLEEGQYGPNGGWVNTFTGVVGFLVNTDVAEPPKSWEDLLKDEYKGGKISSNGLDEPVGGTQQATLMSIALSQGGSVENTDAVWPYLNELFANGSVSEVPVSDDALLRGEYGVSVTYDFNATRAIEQAKEKGVELEFVVPEDGSIHMPSSLLVNGYNSANMDLLKAFMEFVLTDEGQLLFADFGAKPIRYVNGDLDVPEDRRGRWFPEEMYADTQTIDTTKVDPEKLIQDYGANVSA